MDLEASMTKSLEATQRNFNTIRTGRANTSLLDKVMVEYYGADTPLKSWPRFQRPIPKPFRSNPLTWARSP